MTNMTNSEEPSAPDGLSSMNSTSMKVMSETFGHTTSNGTQNHDHNNHHDDHNNYGHTEVDLKKDLSVTCSFTTVSHASSGPISIPTSASPSAVLVSMPNSEDDYYSPHLPGTAATLGSLQQQSAQQYPQQSAGLPFTLLSGETLKHRAEITEGLLALTNYRLFVQTKDKEGVIIPTSLIEQTECRDIFFLHLFCKDARSIKCTFSNNEAALDMMKRLQLAISPPKKLDETFAFSFYRESILDMTDEKRAHLGLDLPPFMTAKERFDAELKRMEFDVRGPWRISDENKDYELCSSYPTHIIVPSVMDKKKLEHAASFRSAKRVPAVVWRHKRNGAVISRCSQPEIGWFGWRSAEDEELVHSIVQACAHNGKPVASETVTRHDISHTPEHDSAGMTNGLSSTVPAGTSPLSSIEVVPAPPPAKMDSGKGFFGFSFAWNPISYATGGFRFRNGRSWTPTPLPAHAKKIMILDARSYATAFANRARGGGSECMEYYTSCEIQFMNLANIHSIRKSFMNVRQLCSLPADQPNWYSQLENCKWLQHMASLIKAATTAVTCIEVDERPVMVHCSDGWDRTPQIVALAEILLDPYYRSFEGFQILVEREWLDFGHKFADRCGQGIASEDTNERCPVFLQWLDCLHQFCEQFPTAFEFNQCFLIKLAQHTYSNLFGTFLCNTSRERQALNMEKHTHSIWRFLRAPANSDKFRNHLYNSIETNKVLWPSADVRDLKLWTQVYLGIDNNAPLLTEVIIPSLQSSPTPSVTADSESSERLSNSKTFDLSKARSSSLENLHTSHSGDLQRRRSCDSLIANKMDDVEGISLPHAETMIKAASEDIQDNKELVLDRNEPDTEGGLKMRKFFYGSKIRGEAEDLSENEDTETNSEGRSESTVINSIKSIESSTDTLVAETGIITESSCVFGNPLPVFEANTKSSCKTETLLEEEIRKLNLTEAASNKTDCSSEENFFDETGEIRINSREKANSELGIIGNSVNLRGKSQDVIEIMNGDRSMKSELCQNEVLDCSDRGPFSNHQCETCTTSLEVVRRRDTVMLNNGSSFSYSGSTTASSNHNIVTIYTNGVQAVPVSTVANSWSSGTGSMLSTYNIPMQSRTPSSGILLTPEDSSYQLTVIKNNYPEKWTPSEISATSLMGVASAVKPYDYDADGLPCYVDEVQLAVSSKFTKFEERIETLQRELHLTRAALMKQVSHKCTQPIERQDDTASVADSICSDEHYSVGQDSYSSDGSWEPVNYKDTEPKFYQADFTANQCCGCYAEFSEVGLRKHRCRKCKKLFCPNCSDKRMDMGDELKNARACKGCYIQQTNQFIGTSAPCLVSNGHSVPRENGNSSQNLQHETPRYLQNGISHLQNDCRRCLTESISSSSSPKGRGIFQRRLSEEMPKTHQPHSQSNCYNNAMIYSKPKPELPSCNGIKSSKVNYQGETDSSVNNILDNATDPIRSNGHSHQ